MRPVLLIYRLVCNNILPMKEAKRFLPFILTAALVVVDQISKLLVMKYIPLNTIGAQFFGDFLITTLKSTAVKPHDNGATDCPLGMIHVKFQPLQRVGIGL